MSEAANLVSTLGFPIAAFIMMFYYATVSLKKNTEAINELKDAVNRLRWELVKSAEEDIGMAEEHSASLVGVESHEKDFRNSALWFDAD